MPELTVFQGDQGLDALAARHLVLDGRWPLEGPATSAGGVHLGPLYYYLLALPMSFGAFDPLAEALLMVVLNALAIAVLYWLLALWFGPRVAIGGAALYAVSPAAIVAARSAWNPAPRRCSCSWRCLAWPRPTACATAAGWSWSVSGSAA